MTEKNNNVRYGWFSQKALNQRKRHAKWKLNNKINSKQILLHIWQKKDGTQVQVTEVTSEKKMPESEIFDDFEYRGEVILWIKNINYDAPH